MSNQIAQQVHIEQNNNQQNMHVRHRKQFKSKQQSSYRQMTTQVQVKKTLVFHLSVTLHGSISTIS